MRFYEYESRAIVRDAGIPVTDYGFAHDRPRRPARSPTGSAVPR